MKIRNGNIWSNGKQSTAKAEEGYCNEATQSGPLTHNQSRQAQNTVEYAGVKVKSAWTKEEIREVIWCYMYCRQRNELQKTAILGTAHILRKVLT